LYLHVKDGIPEEWRYGIIDRNYTLFRSNVLHQRGMYLAIVGRMLWQRGKDVRAENDLLNDLGFNLCVVPWSLVVKLVAVKYGMEQEQSGPEWSGITPEWMGCDNKMRNNLSLSSCAVP